MIDRKCPRARTSACANPARHGDAAALPGICL